MSYTSASAGDDEDWDADELDEAMEEARPLDAPPLWMLGDPDEVRACQRDGFEVGEPEWWRMGEGWAHFVRDGAGTWVPEPEDAPGGG